MPACVIKVNMRFPFGKIQNFTRTGSSSGIVQHPLLDVYGLRYWMLLLTHRKLESEIGDGRVSLRYACTV